MTTTKNLEALQSLVDTFNKTFKVGETCKIKNDEGRIEKVTIKAPASVLGGHTAVGWFEEISGCYNLERVQ